MKTRILFNAILVIVIVMMLPYATAQDEIQKWTVKVSPAICFVNQTVNITVSGGTSYTPFIVDIKQIVDQNLTRVLMKTYLTDIKGNASLNYTPAVAGTYFVYLTDGMKYLSDPASFVCVRNQSNITQPNRDDIQDRWLEEMQRELAFQADLLAKEREWDFINLFINLLMIGSFWLILIYFWHHLIHEHQTYWNRQTPSRVLKYALLGKKTYPNENKGLLEKGKGFYTKWFTMVVSSHPGEVDGFQQEFHNPTLLEELQMHDLPALIKGIGIRKRKVYRIYKKDIAYPHFKFICLNCGGRYDAFGPKSRCPYCAATADFVPPPNHNRKFVFAEDEELSDRIKKEKDGW